MSQLSRKFHIMLHMAACQPCTVLDLARELNAQFSFPVDSITNKLPTWPDIICVTAIECAELMRDGYFERYSGDDEMAFDLTEKGWEWSRLCGGTVDGYNAANKELIDGKSTKEPAQPELPSPS